MRSTWLGPCVVLLAVGSCGFPQLPPLPSGDDGGANDEPVELELVAGNPDGAGNVNGTGAAARFNLPAGVVVDGTGNLYVADAGNSTIRKITGAGVVTTLAGSPNLFGAADGTGAAARLSGAQGMAIDGGGTMFVADTGSNTIRKLTPGGVLTTLAGTPGSFGALDGTGAGARFANPRALAVDSMDNLYVADSSNHTIRKVTPAGVVTTLAGMAGALGSTDGTGSDARFRTPSGVAIDGTGNLYVADSNNHTIRKITPAGVVTTLAGTAGMSGSSDGTGAAARFTSPAGVTIDADGNLYVADGSNTLRKVTPAGVVTTLAGTGNTVGNTDGRGADARFNAPRGAAVDSAGSVYITDSGNDTIRKLNAAGVVTTLAGTPGLTGTEDGTGSAARFDFPVGVVADRAGNLYVTDSNNNTVRKITTDGVVTTLAGTARVAGTADGTGTNASFSAPQGMTTDSAGNLYVADINASIIRKVTPDGVVTTLAGLANMLGSADGTGAAARFNNPQGLVADGAGNLYVTDTGNNTIRKVTSDGVVTTLAGTAGTSGSADGTGAAVRFSEPLDLTIDSAGNLYVTDGTNNTIRKITPAGVVTTLAGTPGMPGSVDGTGAAARFDFPTGLAIDGAGNLYVTDFFDSTLRKITPGGTTTTIAGMAYTSRVVLGTTPQLAYPLFLAIVGDSIVFADNNAILRLRHGAR